MENKKKSNLSVEKQTYGQKGKQTEVQRHHNTNENCKNCNLAKNRVHFFKATFDTPMALSVRLCGGESDVDLGMCPLFPFKIVCLFLSNFSFSFFFQHRNLTGNHHSGERVEGFVIE